MIEYVVGIIYNYSYDKVLLIKKNRPDYLRGYWNGIGGKVEENETFLDAMVRETREETGLTVANFKPFAKITYPAYYIECFMGTGMIHEAQQLTDEELGTFHYQNLPLVLPNMHWLVPMARDVRITEACVMTR